MPCLTVSNAELCHVFRRGQCTVSILLLAWLHSEISKRKYYQSQFLECGNDSAKLWKLINTLTNSQVKTHSYPNKLLNPINSQHTGNPEKMANIFNDYFVTVGKHIASSIIPPCSNTYIGLSNLFG